MCCTFASVSIIPVRAIIALGVDDGVFLCCTNGLSWSMPTASVMTVCCVMHTCTVLCVTVLMTDKHASHFMFNSYSATRSEQVTHHTQNMQCEPLLNQRKKYSDLDYQGGQGLHDMTSSQVVLSDLAEKIFKTRVVDSWSVGVDLQSGFRQVGQKLQLTFS